MAGLLGLDKNSFEPKEYLWTTAVMPAIFADTSVLSENVAFQQLIPVSTSKYDFTCPIS
jgi:hypothetical protein